MLKYIISAGCVFIQKQNRNVVEVEFYMETLFFHLFSYLIIISMVKLPSILSGILIEMNGKTNLYEVTELEC